MRNSEITECTMKNHCLFDITFDIMTSSVHALHNIKCVEIMNDNSLKVFLDESKIIIEMIGKYYFNNNFYHFHLESSLYRVQCDKEILILFITGFNRKQTDFYIS